MQKKTLALLVCAAALCGCARWPIEPDVPPVPAWGPDDPRQGNADQSRAESTRPKHHSDERIRQNLFQSLAADPDVDVFNYRFRVRNGGVEIHDEAPGIDSGQKRTEMLARQVPGVKDVRIVEDHPEALPPEAAALPPEEALRRQVIDRILADSRTEAAPITVSLHEGVLTLRGTVSRLGSKLAAEQDARSVPGIQKVNDFLTVRTPAPAPGSDQRLRREILTALRMDPYFNPEDVHVGVKEGTVELSGEVPTPADKSGLTDKISQIRGVIRIVDETRVAAR